MDQEVPGSTPGASTILFNNLAVTEPPEFPKVAMEVATGFKRASIYAIASCTIVAMTWE